MKSIISGTTTVSGDLPDGTTLDELVGYAPLALDLMLGSIYTYEKERQMKHDPRLAKLDR